MDSLSESRSFGPRYRVVTELGAGGTADVFLAVLDELGSGPTLCVLKTPRRGFASDEELLKMFRRESRLAARLQHINIVEVFEIIEDHGHPVLVMEFLEGASLRELQRMTQQTGQFLPLREQLMILQEVCKGLHYSHELRDFDGTPMGLVHRDVSPHNIFVTFDNRVKLLDFGIAKLNGGDRDTATGLVKGKLRYMAPEHMMGGDVDRRADVYAMGVLLWEALAGRLMWEDVNDAVLMQRTVNGEIPDPDPVVAGCTPQLVEIARTCLALDPANRFGSCEELGIALGGMMDRLPPSEITFGQVTSFLFDERRRRLRSQVTTLLDGTTANGSITGPIEWHQVPAGVRPIGIGAVGVERTQVPPRRSTLFLGGLAVGSAALAVVAWFALDRSTGHELERMQPKLGTVAATVITPHTFAPEITDDSIEINIRVEPAEAEVRLDGVRLSAPYELKLPRDNASHVISASAEGFENISQTVVLDRDLRVSLRLDRKRRPLPAVRRTRRDPAVSAPSPEPSRPEPAVTRTPAPAASNDDCDPPFIIDDRGIKRFKRQCL